MTDAPKSASSPSKTRDPYFDNARGVLILLVVIGHVLEQLKDSASAEILAAWIYSFHMPAFILISGYLSRRFTGTAQQCGRLLSGILIPYLLFQLVHAGLATLVQDEPFKFNFDSPAWTTWFLLGLVVWRLLTPLIRAVRYPLILAILISVIAPLDSSLSQTWSMARVLSFLPFYVLGTLLKPEHFTFIRRKVKAWIGYAALLLGLGAAALLTPPLSSSTFHLSKNYEAHGDELVRGVLLRLAVLAVGLIGTLAILSITGSGQNLWTRFGRFSIYIYLLHPVALYWFRHSDMPDIFTTTAHTAGLIVASAILTLLLATPPIIYLTRWLIEPPWAALLLKPASSTSPELPHDDVKRRSGSK